MKYVGVIAMIDLTFFNFCKVDLGESLVIDKEGRLIR
jgi:hypothetical protein